MIVRMARTLREKGHEPVFVRFNQKPVALLEEISRYANIVLIDDLLSKDRARKIGAIDAIYCYTEDTLVRMLYHSGVPSRRIVFGIYHPRQYHVAVRFGDSFMNQLFRRIFAVYPRRNIVFMNEEVRRACEGNLHMDMAGANILPLPVDVGGGPPVSRSRNGRRIVSIGRLVEFKNYHAPVIEFVARQRAEGLPFEYHIYGEGPMRPRIEAIIAEHGAREFVTLHGTLPYEDLPSVLFDAAVMIGMGTAMIEAAARGVPVIAAIDMQPILCHGWFHQTTGYCVGEATNHLPSVPIRRKLEEQANWSEAEYLEAARQSWVRACDFSASKVVDDFLRILERAATVENIRVSRWEWIRFWASKAYARHFTQPGWKHK